jgi:glycosyltransferase involved in cell wall biosynthesis
MRISHVSVSTLPVLHRYGGAIERRIIEIAREQVRRGHQVTVYSVGDEQETHEIEGVTYQCINCRARLPWKHFEFQYKTVRKLRQARDDVVHFHSQPEGALMSSALSAKKVLSYDYYAFRGGRKTPLYYAYKYILRRFDLLLPCSEYCLQESQNFWHLPEQKLRVLYNGVNTEQFRPDPTSAAGERDRLGIGQRPVVLYVGRVCKQKGSDVLLEAMALLNARRSDIQLVVAGPIGQFGLTDDPNRWRERIEQVGGLYLGAVEESRLSAIYNLADVFVMPTRLLEMFGMAAVEAQACGKPVIASDCGGLCEVVPDDCGARFPAGASAQLADEIGKLIDDPGRRASCSANALRNAAKYRWGAICDTLEGLYASHGGER